MLIMFFAPSVEWYLEQAQAQQAQAQQAQEQQEPVHRAQD
jgi:hypothetical protein